MDRLEAMSVLLAVAEAGSISAASRKLKIPLATISRKVSELEAHLNARLLMRSNRNISLTEAGQSFVALHVPFCKTSMTPSVKCPASMGP